MFAKVQPWWRFWHPMSGALGGLTLGAIIGIAGALLLVFCAPAPAQTVSTPAPGPTIEQRIGHEIGPLIVRAAVLSAQNEELKAIVAQRDKAIADLQAQITELKKAKPQ